MFFGRVVTMASPPEEKVRLFKAMFRGREDVYARRYVSAKSGKSGYSPACAVEWAHGLCDKKRVSCAVCPNRRLLADGQLDVAVMQTFVRMDDAGRVFDADRRKVATRLVVDDANPSQKSHLLELVDNPAGVRAIIPA